MNSDINKIITEFVKDTKKLLKDNMIEEYLFGSYAKNKQTDMSDIDILIIVKNFDRQIREKLSSLSSEYSLKNGIVISPIVKDIHIWEKNKRYNTLFFKEIEKHGIQL